VIAHVFSQPPKEKCEACITSEKKDLVNLKLEDMKKSISARWKLFIKDNEKSDEVFCGEDKKSKKFPPKDYTDSRPAMAKVLRWINLLVIFS
jgi:hypothetical protein